ncbi:MAG: 7-cyano-7-deazaguanine synthase QueC [Candidatus Margulisbacteria bacterium]|nr:7-cyano-7-deazaguanine synthase QueC [Candidatus Margulisiibacteriota bacterium]MBU1021368.1 7-cyano-7-deazaguanine synthase QueC [Candidatus Margulisiibacteriota bacterium]MBU1729143.1 7-cyano-7-deazaguanine synthase QueC [Candidatus Margulisiibacteriota bacterium]MBU1954816.1 7-cyano-7-deazaguanine synthase QueC [Candidatus Margulisiibacteriota bacterium]
MKKKKAIVLLSGGLDSTTTLYYAKDKGYQCFALVFDYGQRHKRELRAAKAVAKRAKVSFQLMKISLPWKGSSLLDKKKKVPTLRSLSEIAKSIPSTYVPARNTIFLSFALSYAEAIGAETIFIGANAIDFSGYPDCRPRFYQAFQKVIQEGTKKKKIRILTPLIHKTKAQIIRLGTKLKAPLNITWSCYKGGKKPCEVCDSCRLRLKGERASRRP